jgi:hypothetical protein
MQVMVGVKTTGKDDKRVSVGTMTGREGVGSAVTLPPQADKRSHRKIQTLTHVAYAIVDTEISFLCLSVSI